MIVIGVDVHKYSLTAVAVDDTARSHLEDRDRVHITMRVDADHVVQLTRKHPYRPPATGWGSQPEPVWGLEPRAADLWNVP